MADTKTVSKFSWLVTAGKFLKHGVIAVAVILITAWLQGLQQFMPTGDIQIMLWKIGSGSVIGLVVALLNWLKNKDM